MTRNILSLNSLVEPINMLHQINKNLRHRNLIIDYLFYGSLCARKTIFGFCLKEDR